MSRELIINIITVVVCVGAIAYAYYCGKEEIAKTIIKDMVLEAEKLYGSGKGNVKYAYVVDKVYPKLPSVIKVFMTEEHMGELIEYAVDDMKKKLSEEKGA